MDDLIAFIVARLDDDELGARNAGGETWDFTGVNCEVRVREHKGYGEFGRVAAYCRHGSAEEDLALAIHVAEHDPARVLRRVEWTRHMLNTISALAEGQPSFAHCLLSELGAEWSDHPDYRQEWKP